MDPGGYSKRGLSDLLSDLLSQTIDVQPPPTFLVQDLRPSPSHFSIAGVGSRLPDLFRDVWEFLRLDDRCLNV